MLPLLLPALLPMLPSLLNIAIQHAPGLIGALGGENSGKAAEKVIGVAREVLGTTDPKEVEAKLAADPALAETFTARLNAETEQLWIEMQDVANARALGLGLVQARHWTANMPAIVVLLIMGMYFGFTGALFAIGIEIPGRMFQLLMIAYGTLSTAFGTAIAYYLGTTRQNAQKDDQNALLTSALTKTSGNVVPLRKAA